MQPDILHFGNQYRELRRLSLPNYAALFRDIDDQAVGIPVLIRVPDFDDLRGSYESSLETLQQSGLKLVEVSSRDAEEIFVDRISEFVAVSSSNTQGWDTTVHTNRRGDTVLYAKGYFVSTGTAFGISTPAYGRLNGRYSFGIMLSGKPKFDNIVWSCPATVKVELP